MDKATRTPAELLKSAAARLAELENEAAQLYLDTLEAERREGSDPLRKVS